jgi:glycosyltransferase involved in cell wall biosynthesis
MLPLLARRGIEPAVVCLERSGNGVEAEVVAAGFDVLFLRSGGPLRRPLELRRIIRAKRPDVVHTVIFESDVTGRIAALGTPAKVVTSLVNTSYDRARVADPRVPRAKLAAVRRIDSWTARLLTHRFHAVSESVKCSCAAELRIPAERIAVIERGRDDKRLGAPSPERRRAARAALGIADDDEVIVNVARHEFQKGLSHLVDAIGLLRDRPRLVLLQAGRRGHTSDELGERARRTGAGDRIRFLGYRDDVPELLAAADVFVFPSIYEGLGGALIEAMALGLPIVASDIAAMREVLEPGRNALLVEPGDAAGLAAAISTLLDDPARRSAFGERSRAIFEERFGLERSVARLTELYEEL